MVGGSSLGTLVVDVGMHDYDVYEGVVDQVSNEGDKAPTVDRPALQSSEFLLRSELIS